MSEEEAVKKILEEARKQLKLECRAAVFDGNKKLDKKDLIKPQKQEEFTKKFIIEKILDLFGISYELSERSFVIPKGGIRNVDYECNSKKGSFILEAKPVNEILDCNRTDCAVNQIKDIFMLKESKDFQFGVATNGLKWIFINPRQEIIAELSLENDFQKIKGYLTGKREAKKERRQEEISKRFYEWYNALLHGGSYRGLKSKVGRISESNCLVNNIRNVSSREDREEIAQTIIDRLIFIKFLQAKGLIKSDVLEYLASLSQDALNWKLNNLFFNVLNTEKEKRGDVDPMFADIPYLNGSLFTKTKPEERNQLYTVKAEILKKVIEFLNSFRFVSESVEEEEALNPEILGYIFERAMTATDRKGTGAYYTPKYITRYICENTIYPLLLDRINQFLKDEKGYKETELLTGLDELFIRISDTTLSDINVKILPKITICDPACGSGVFLLAAAEVLFEIYRKIRDKMGTRRSDVDLKKIILQNNIFGVDINHKGIEIAKLRLWLWMAESYVSGSKIEPLPNIEYNLRAGNSLIGYIDISKFRDVRVSMDDYLRPEEALTELMNRRDSLVDDYRSASGEKAQTLRKEIEELNRKIKTRLDAQLFNELKAKVGITPEEFAKLDVFHWGFEFHDIFSNGQDDTGFDVVIGNPPYGNILKNDAKKAIFNFKTKKASEIAANFLEHSLHLTRNDGYVGFIIANSIAINKSTSSARRLIREHMSKSKMLLFGTRPAKIFADAEIRVMIFLGKKDEPDKEGTIFTTEAIKFTTEQKTSLLHNLSFESSEGLSLGKKKIGDGIEDVSLPKVGNPKIRSILIKLKENSDIVIKDRINKKGFRETMEFRKTGGYWLNALEEMPYKSTKIEPIKFENTLERDFCILLINSSLFYLYWSTYSNLRDFPRSLLEKFPIPKLDELNNNKKRIEDLKEKISKCLLDAFIPERGRVGEFKTALCKHIIDQIDDFLGHIYGLNKEEVEFIKRYDNHIRKL